jgi:hypothetical protein
VSRGEDGQHAHHCCCSRASLPLLAPLPPSKGVAAARGRELAALKAAADCWLPRRRCCILVRVGLSADIYLAQLAGFLEALMPGCMRTRYTCSSIK